MIDHSHFGAMQDDVASSVKNCLQRIENTRQKTMEMNQKRDVNAADVRDRQFECFPFCFPSATTVPPAYYMCTRIHPRGMFTYLTFHMYASNSTSCQMPMPIHRSHYHRHIHPRTYLDHQRTLVSATRWKTRRFSSRAGARSVGSFGSGARLKRDYDG